MRLFNIISKFVKTEKIQTISLSPWSFLCISFFLFLILELLL